MKYFVVDQGCAASGVSRACVHACCVRGYDGTLLLAVRHISLNLHSGDLKMALQCVLYVCVCFFYFCAGGEENTWTHKNRRNRKRGKNYAVELYDLYFSPDIFDFNEII